MATLLSTICFLIIICLFSLLFSLASNNFVLAYSNSFHATLQQPQPKILCHDHEKLALLQFKQSLLINCTAFARPKMKSWLPFSSDHHHHLGNGTDLSLEDCCKWDGVKCNEETGHVIGLDLSNSCLYGTFPLNNSLYHLNHLLELNLANNNFDYSQIPSTIGRLSKLRKLNLSHSAFIGQIPFEMSKLSTLSILDLSSNDGLEFGHDLSFKKLVKNLTNLTQLLLDYVDISSVVPVILGNFTSLKVLSLNFCNLYGMFPTKILQLPNLENISLFHNNNLRGIFPEFPYNSPLRILELGSTSFSGELPPSIGRLSHLTSLNLWRASFAGPIPSSIGNLTKLTHLNLGGFGNNFKGDLPYSVTNLTHLTSLHLSNLCVSPRILNSWLLKLNKLEELELSRNVLCGGMPPALANLTRLNWLDLRYNQLTSPLPLSLANLTKLTDLYLYDNQFQGPVIPSWFSHLTSLETLSLSSNGSVGMFDPLLKLPYLQTLNFYGINLKFPTTNASTNSSLSKFGNLQLVACNLTEFPMFLRYQDGLFYLDLSGNNITGNIPQWFVNTTANSLLVIILDINSISGFEQPQVFLPWNNLEVFYMNFNMFQGVLPIPPKSLKIYGVYQNKLSGAIPEEICSATSLAYLDLSGNNLNGHIPSCIGPLLATSMQVLNLLGNNLHGTISHISFTRACKLKMINLSKNQLGGPLPKSLDNCTMLEVLDVGENRVNDTFPSWLGNLPNLQALILRHNRFSGTIDTSNNRPNDHFHSLRIIDLSYNFFCGDLPYSYLENWPAMRVTIEDQPNASNTDIEIDYSAMGTIYTINEQYPYEITITNKGRDTLYTKVLTISRVIDFSSNNFTSEIPDILGKLRGLQALNLSNNNLVGGIPSSLGNITDLESLDLSQNMLSGEIPQQLVELTSLEVFNVSHNRLVGRIPQGKQFNTFDDSSFDGNLALCGAFLSKKCEYADTPHPPPPSMTNDETEEDSKLIDWIIRSLGCAGGLIVGFIIGKLYITDRYHDWFIETFGRRRRPKPRARRSALNRRRH